MKFRTEIIIKKSGFHLLHSDKVFTVGSCFAENIAKYFSYYKMRVLSNPFGVLYNPVSIMNSLDIISEKRELSKKDLILNQTEWHSFYHHSDFSHHEADVSLENINKATLEGHDFLTSTDLVIITLGTSFVFRHKERGHIVSNCHKIPASEFENYLLTSNEIESSLNSTIEIIKRINPKTRILFTVSPVRHWKNGAIDNQLSKAKLIVGLHEVISQNEKTFYFPSYELMMDDLRDYRFYAEDLLHPNNIATDYIWDKFSDLFFNSNTKKLLSEIDSLVKSCNHRVRNKNSEKHLSFVKATLEKISQIEAQHTHIDLDFEKNILND